MFGQIYLAQCCVRAPGTPKIAAFVHLLDMRDQIVLPVTYKVAQLASEALVDCLMLLEDRL